VKIRSEASTPSQTHWSIITAYLPSLYRPYAKRKGEKKQLCHASASVGGLLKTPPVMQVPSKRTKESKTRYDFLRCSKMQPVQNKTTSEG
jgi:hypothetical protein